MSTSDYAYLLTVNATELELPECSKKPVRLGASTGQHGIESKCCAPIAPKRCKALS